jgi:hypothetical protein
MSKKTILISTAAAIAALALSGSAFAADQQGMSVVKDAATGQLRAPTADEAAQLQAIRAQQRAAASAAAANRSGLARGASAAATVAPGTTIQHANGAVEMTVDSEQLSYSVVTKDADGKLVLQCVTGTTAADKAMSTPATQSKEHQHDVK